MQSWYCRTAAGQQPSHGGAEDAAGIDTSHTSKQCDVWFASSLCYCSSYQLQVACWQVLLHAQQLQVYVFGQHATP
jgi:hypothetical protein